MLQEEHQDSQTPDPQSGGDPGDPHPWGLKWKHLQSWTPHFWKQTAVVFPIREPTPLPGPPLPSPLSTTSHRTCPRAEAGTPEWPSPGAFNQCQWAQVLSWPRFYTTNSSFLAKEGNAEDQMALGSLAAPTPVELVFMQKKKITPGWSCQGDQPAGGSTEVLRAGHVYGPEHLGI